MTIERFSVGRAFAGLFAVATIATLAALPAQAALIQPDSAIASSFFDPSYAPVHTINGSGLPPNFVPSDPHAAYAPSNHWTTSGGPPASEFIVWGLTVPQTLNTIYLWNHQSNGGIASNPGYDVTSFDLTLLDASSATLLTLNDVALAPDTTTGQAFSFGSTISGISSVRFDIEAVQSSPDFTGLAEVAFANVAAIPEPSTYALMLAGLGLVGFAAIRRRRSVAACAAM